jgi:type IV pilus assembly protein PilO
MALLDKINEIDSKQRLIILGLILGLMVAGFWYGVWQPKRTAIATLERQVTDKKSALGQLQMVAKEIERFKQETKGLELKLDELKTKLPQSKEIPTLLRDISQAGIEGGLQFDMFRPGGEEKKEFYAEVPVEISIRGPYHNIGMFLDKVAHLPRIVSVSNLALTNPKEENQFIFVSGNGRIVTYRYIEKEAPKK